MAIASVGGDSVVGWTKSVCGEFLFATNYCSVDAIIHNRPDLDSNSTVTSSVGDG